MILAAAIAAASVSPILAQDNNFAPAAGEFSVEVQFNPFSNDFGTFKLDQLKGRYFFSDKDAISFGIGFGFDNVKSTPDPDNNDEIWSKGKLGTFSIDLGYERHFFNYKRIDLYAGAGLGYALQSVSATNQWLDGDDKLRETKICNAMTTDNPAYEERSYNEFNIKAFTGIDFFVYKGLFVGAELGIKFGFQSYPGYYVKGGYNDNGVWSDSYESDKRNKVNGIQLSTYVEPALRLGWAF